MEGLINKLPEKKDQAEITEQLNNSIDQTRQFCAKYNVESF